MKTWRIFLRLLIIAFSSGTLMVILFLMSENEVHRNNAFTRRFPHHPIKKMFDLPINYNSYYISGFDNGKLFLGNTTAPLHLLEIDLETKDTSHIKIEVMDTKSKFYNLEVVIEPPYFFVLDGIVPLMLKGKIMDWKCKPWVEDVAYFNKAVVLDSSTVIISTTDFNSQSTTLGVINKEEQIAPKLITNNNILEKQMDGVFDVDGILIGPTEKNKIGYVYFYRNQYMIVNSQLELIKKQRTIDTVEFAQLKVTNLNNGTKKFGAPPLLVNLLAALNDDYLFISSNRLGKYDNREMLEEAAVIDVYNWKSNSYEFSFYFYKTNTYDLKEFAVHQDYIVGLFGETLSVNKFQFHSLNSENDF